VTDTDVDTDSGREPASGPDPASAPRPRRGRAVVLAGALVLLAVAVGVFFATRPGDEDEPRAATTTTATPSTTASDEEPPGTDPDAVKPYIAALLTRYDEVTSQIVADPDIAADPNHELYAELHALMDPNSEMTEAVTQALVDRGERGVSVTAFGDAERPITRTVDGDVETVSESEVSFPVCTRYDYRMETSSRIDTAENELRRSEGTAVRIDGHWVISVLEGNEDAVDCEESR
jgi:protein-disulfide isomerase